MDSIPSVRGRAGVEQCEASWYNEEEVQYFEQIFSYDWENLARQKLSAEVSTGTAPAPRDVAAA